MLVSSAFTTSCGRIAEVSPRLADRSTFAIMGNSQTELGMRVAFYVYPCLLFVVLLEIQAVQYYWDHRQQKAKTGTAGLSKQKPKSLTRAQVWLIWILQLVLSCLLLGSVIFATRGVFSRDHEEAGSVEWPLSSYVVSTLALACRDGTDDFMDVGVSCWSFPLLCSWFAPRSGGSVGARYCSLLRVDCSSCHGGPHYGSNPSLAAAASSVISILDDSQCPWACQGCAPRSDGGHLRTWQRPMDHQNSRIGTRRARISAPERQCRSPGLPRHPSQGRHLIRLQPKNSGLWYWLAGLPRWVQDPLPLPLVSTDFCMNAP